MCNIIHYLMIKIIRIEIEIMHNSIIKEFNIDSINNHQFLQFRNQICLKNKAIKDSANIMITFNYSCNQDTFISFIKGAKYWVIVYTLQFSDKMPHAFWLEGNKMSVIRIISFKEFRSHHFDLNEESPQSFILYCIYYHEK